MAKKCCYYERGSDTKYICTVDDTCPELVGWTLVGHWGVENCDDCFSSGDTDDGDEFDLGRIAPGSSFLEELEEAIILSQWVKENWDKVFPDHPLGEGFKEFGERVRGGWYR